MTPWALFPTLEGRLSQDDSARALSLKDDVAVTGRPRCAVCFSSSLAGLHSLTKRKKNKTNGLEGGKEKKKKKTYHEIAITHVSNQLTLARRSVIPHHAEETLRQTQPCLGLYTNRSNGFDSFQALSNNSACWFALLSIRRWQTHRPNLQPLLQKIQCAWIYVTSCLVTSF